MNQDMTLSEELQWRGFINQTTLTDLKQLDRSEPWTFYHGYDASADSLQAGNLAALMMDRCFVRHGQKAVLLAGGATSLIGDPGGKDSERQLQAAEIINSNVAKVRTQIEKLFHNEPITMVNNLDWFKDINVLDFLRDAGKHFSMTPLLQRDFITARIGEEGGGISFAEFSYTILQGYDFWKLYKDHNVTLQLAGSDQWGNSLSGVDYLRRVEQAEVHVLTCPLIINKATGKKFGKSEEGAVWLDKERTSVYKFYQFWLNSDDEGVESYLKVFTELNKAKIDQVMNDFNQNKSSRTAQKTLAYEVTKLVHGEEEADSAVKITETLFGSRNINELSESDFVSLEGGLPVVKASNENTLIDLIVEANLATSKTEASRFLGESAIYVNNVQCDSNKIKIETSDFVHGYALLRRGKNNQVIVKLDS